MKVVTAIAKAMKAEGVEILFAYPVNPLIEAAAEENIRTVIVRQERIGLHMADAYSRIGSGEKFGVFCMQHGPGAENAFGGVAQAYSESSPVLVIPGGYPRHLAHYYPNFNSTLNMQHITKWAEPVTSGRAVPDLLRRAFFQLRNGRPGPVLLEVPADLWNEEVPDGWVHVPSYTARSAPDPADLAQAAGVLAAARRPVIYAGQGVHYARAWAELKALAEAWNIPVTTSIEGKSAFPEDHPLSLGSGGRANPRAVKSFLADADVILGVGCSFALTGFGVGMPPGKTIIHATLDPMDLNKDVAAQYGLIGDARLTLTALSQAMDGLDKSTAAARQDVPFEIARLRRAWLAEWAPKLENDATPINPYRVIAELNRLVDKANTTITHDAGSPRDQLTPFWESTAPLTYIGWGKTTQLGSGLGFAMGAKLARPGPPVHQRLGRRGHRLHRHGPGDRRARADPDPVDPVQQLLHGHRDTGHAGLAGEVRVDGHLRELRRHGPRIRLLRRADHRPRRHRRGAQARHRRHRAGPARPAGVHHRQGADRLQRVTAPGGQPRWCPPMSP